MHLIFFSVASLSHWSSNEKLLTSNMTETDVVLSDVGVSCGASLFDTDGAGEMALFQFIWARSLIKWF